MDKLCNDMCNLLKPEIDRIISRCRQKGTVDPQDIEMLYKPFILLEKAKKIEHMEREDRERESYARMPRTYYADRSMNNDGRSYERGRDPMTGQYVSYDSHGGYSIRDQMISRLEEMIPMAKSEQERMQIEDQIRRMRESY